MTTRTRFAILLVTAPVLAFAIVGGLLGKTLARQETYPHLRVFDDVFSLTTDNYVEEVDPDRLMHGAMHGLAEALDADSAYLTPAEAKLFQAGSSAAPADIGLDLTRQYYLRVVAARDGSPAAKAGLRPGDFIRIIDQQPTREMSAWEGQRRLGGAAGSSVKLTVIRGNAAEPHVVDITREVLTSLPVAGKIVGGNIGYLRVAEFTAATDSLLRAAVEQSQKSGARALVIDLRSTARGALPTGIACARAFVASGTIALRDSRTAARETVTAKPGESTIALPVAVLIDTGTAGAAELFAAALSGNGRAELIGERTNGRAAVQRLFPLPDGAALWMSYAWYLTPAGKPIHERGLQPDVAVDQPDVDFGATPAVGDPTLDKAVERLKAKIAA
jgi:carboxyl-terminal processing protease